MTSFAVQAVTSTLAYVSNRRLSSREKAHNTGKAGEANGKVPEDGELSPHADLVEKAHERLESTLKKRYSASTEVEDDNKSERQFSNEEEELANRVLTLATKLEGHARRLLVGHLSQSSDETVVQAGTLLKADWNVQRRAVLELLGGDTNPDLDIDGDGKGDFQAGAQSDLQKGVNSGKETLEEVLGYRQCFAAILAAGSRLQGLEGHKRLVFERRRLKSSSPSKGQDNS
jgi:potassium channel subfamily K